MALFVSRLASFPCSVILKKANMDAQGIRTNFLKAGGRRCCVRGGVYYLGLQLGPAAGASARACTQQRAAARSSTQCHAAACRACRACPMGRPAPQPPARERWRWRAHLPCSLPAWPRRAGTIARGAAETGAVEAYMCARLMRHPLVRGVCDSGCCGAAEGSRGRQRRGRAPPACCWQAAQARPWAGRRAAGEAVALPQTPRA